MYIFLSCKLYIHVCYSLFPGNKYIHLLTQAGNNHVLRIEVKFVGPFLNTYSYAIEYSHFSVGNASTAYKLDVSGYSGLIGKHLKTLCRNIDYIFLYYFVYQSNHIIIYPGMKEINYYPFKIFTYVKKNMCILFNPFK